MLNEQQINALPYKVEERLAELNELYLQKIGQRLSEIGTLTASDQHRLLQFKQFGTDTGEIAKQLARINEVNIEDIYQIFETVAKDNAEFSKQFFKASNTPYIPYEENKALQEYAKSIAKQTADTYQNLSQTLGFAMKDKNGETVFTSLSETYQNMIDLAVSKVGLGLESYQAVMRATLKQLADSGIRTIDYKTGYKKRADTAVRQNILWGVKTLNQGMQEQLGKEFGADGYEISYHSNPRPSHVDMGGRQYSLKQYNQKGIANLLSDYGCLHFKFSILMGVSQPTYSSEQLAKLKLNDNRVFDFDGKTYTGYQATQTQRKLETAIRHAKDRCLIAKASNDPILRMSEQAKLNVLVDKYKDFSSASGLPVKKERMSVAGFRSVKVDFTKPTISGKIQLSKLEEHAINTYISSESYKINDILRNRGVLSEYQKGIVTNLDSALDKLPKYQGVVYRSVSDFGIENVDDFIKSHKVGGIKTFDAYTSCSTGVHDSNFPIQYVITSNTGVDIRIHNPTEQEILFKRNTKFEILKIENNIIYMEEG